MIRRCFNCSHFTPGVNSCDLVPIKNAYNHKKKEYFTTRENNYCAGHRFKNEDILEKEAIVVEYDTVLDALNEITEKHKLRDFKKNNHETI